MPLYLEPVCPLFWWLNPPKQGPFQPKQGSFGFQAYTKGGHSSVKNNSHIHKYGDVVRPAQPDRVLCLSPLRRLNGPQVRRFHFQVKMQSIPSFGPLLEVRMSKNLHTVAAFVARSTFTLGVRTAFGGANVEKTTRCCEDVMRKL